jgi:multidrug efflux pump subunit AcrA (membrane-fusion protein)
VRDDRANLATGLALNAYVPQGTPAAWTLVPKDALVYQGLNTTVFVVRGGFAVPTPVRVAFPIGEEVAIEPGVIDAGASVVVEGNERLIPGSAVAPIAAKTAPAAETAR